MSKPSAYRLPTHIRPLSYDIELTADPRQPDFTGQVVIELDVQRPALQIEMHSRDLVLIEAGFTLPGAPHQPHSARIELNADQQTVIFTPEVPLPAGPATLRVAFRGKHNPSMHGLYLAQDGHERAICTQCEATDARAIFPCFDEPEFKASLKWTLHTDKDVVALSNGALDWVEERDGGKTWRFHRTRPVSSYLSALVIGDLEGSEAVEVSGVPLRVWSMRGKVGQTRFAVDFTRRLLPFYEDYFGCPYAYGKYDQVAVPGFDAGAMENIGLVLFRQNLLLMDPATASWRQEKLIAKVIAHEFAHMWFGNLVTMKWWDDLWLNEAFAEWMAHKATDRAEPSYQVWNDFQDDKNRALVDDALPTTHPIWTPVQTPQEAIEMFDAITYQKGCAVMRMLENFLGEGPFRDGLRAYMKAFSEKNATGPDLWQKLEAASGQPVGELMQSWVAQPGFPLVAMSLRQATAKESPGTYIDVEQARFFSSPKAQQSADQGWVVPVVVRFQDEAGVHEHRFLLRGRSGAERLPATGGVRWCYGNAHEIGFYRVQLAPAMLQDLLKHGLSHLSGVEQMGLIEDQWALVRSGRGTIEPFVQVLAGFAAVKDHNVLRAVVDRLHALDLLLKDSRDRAARLRFRTWVAGLLGEHLTELGYEVRPGEAQNEIQRRASVIGTMAGLARVPEAIARAEQMAQVEQQDPRAVDPNLAGVFVGVAAKFGDEARFATFVDTFRQRKSSGATPQETLRYLHSLATFRTLPAVARTLGLLEDGTVPQESVGTLLGQMLGARHGQEPAWAYVKAHWATLRGRVGDMGLSRLVEAVGGLRWSWREDIQEFFQKHPPAGAERALSRAMEAMEQREELRQRVTPGLLKYFGSNP